MPRQNGHPPVRGMRKEEVESAAAEAAATLKRARVRFSWRASQAIPMSNSLAQTVLVDESLPHGVGVMGRGRAAINVLLVDDGHSVQVFDNGAHMMQFV